MKRPIIVTRQRPRKEPELTNKEVQAAHAAVLAADKAIAIVLNPWPALEGQPGMKCGNFTVFYGGRKT